MNDMVIQDVGGYGEYDGVFDSFEDLGVDMFGDFSLGEVTPAMPRASVPTNATVVTKAVAATIPKRAAVVKAVQAKKTAVKPIARKGVVSPPLPKAMAKAPLFPISVASTELKQVAIVGLLLGLAIYGDKILGGK